MKHLQQDYDRLENVLETMTDAFISIDRQWNVTYVNTAAERILGRQRNDLLEKDFRRSYSDPDAERFHNRYARAMDECIPVSFEEYYEPISRWIEVRAFPSPEGLSIFFRDITERKKTETALRESQADLNRAQNVAHIGNWRMNVKSNQLQWSDETYRIFGIPAGTPLTYESFISTVHPDDRKDVNENWNTALKGKPYDIEHRIIVGNHIKWVREKAELEFDADGNLTGAFGIAQDITGRKKAEMQLRKSEARFRTLAENSPDVIARFDRQLRHSYLNPYGAQVYGVPREEVIGKTNADLGMPDEKVAFWKVRFDEVFLTGKQKTIEFEFNSPNLGRRHFLSVFVPEFDDTDTVNSVLAITRDVTEMKEVQQRLEASNRELEQFAYVASHDLQEPLRMVASYTELLNRRYGGQLDERAHGYMNYIVEGSKRMQRLVQDLLTFSRVGRLDDGYSRIDTGRVVEKVMQHLEETIRDTNTTISCDPLPAILANETNLIQLFQNLVGNAIKFRKKDVPPRIHIAARRKKRTWEFSVSDNGIGIDPKYFSKLFVIFKRLHSRNEYSGTGIGLAICKKIVEAHGGRIWVDSKPGSGATFYFTLPIEGKEK